MEAIVLAGGLGSRLNGVLRDIPKPMAPINSIPFLEYILKFLKTQSVNKVILSVGYRSEVIYKYFGLSYKGIEIIYSIEDEPLGTGGAIKRAIQYTSKEYFFIINGDTFFQINLKKMVENFVPGTRLMLALKTMHNFDRYGCVQMNLDGFITSFLEKGFKKTGSINGGIYLARKNLFKGFDLADKFSFEEFIEGSFVDLSATCMIFNDYFIDIGIPKDLKRADKELKILM
jgi:D-glycero-alpha-D-manno-heptose 1-phosphate guanylyltransferase